MSFEKATACADMTLANAIDDYAAEENITPAEARNELLNSKAYECLYNFDSLLWMEGSDYFLDYYRKNEKSSLP